jgi:hypothetical protein
MNDFKLKMVLTVLSALLFSLIFIMLSLVLPTSSSNGKQVEDVPETQFQKMSKGMREGFKK